MEQTVHSSNHTARLKSQLVSAAVQENADTIADRVPAPLRPARRWLALCAYWTRQTVMPAAIVMAMIVIARWSTAGESGVVPTANASSPPLATAPPPSPPVNALRADAMVFNPAFILVLVLSFVISVGTVIFAVRGLSR